MADRGSDGASHGKGQTCAVASIGAGRAGHLGGRLRVKKARGVSVEQGQVRARDAWNWVGLQDARHGEISARAAAERR